MSVSGSSSSKTSHHTLLARASFLFSGNSGVAIIAFFQSALVTRALGPGQYGIWAIVVSTCGLLQALLGFRTSEPLTKAFAERRKSGNSREVSLLVLTALAVDFVCGVLAFAAVFFCTSFVAAKIADNAQSVEIIHLYAFTMLLSFPESTWFVLARANRRFRLLGALPFTFSALRLCGIAIFTGLHAIDLYTLTYVFIAVACLKFAVTWINILRIGRTYQIHFSAGMLKEFFSFQKSIGSFWRFMRVTYLSSSVSTFVKSGDVLILGYFTDNRSVGLYRLASTLATTIYSIAGALALVVYQEFNEMVVEERFNDIKILVTGLVRSWVLPITAGAAAIIAGGYIFIPKIFGAPFLDSRYLFGILLLGYVLPTLFFWSQSLLLALGKAHIALVITLSNTAFFVICAALFVPVGGSWAMSIIMGLTWTLGSIMQAKFSLRVLGNKIN